ncbi:MAG: hypothetical protein Q8K86_09515 [Candidatus Nanopelagicaceae bacterium]|nr:hypothetical protein [Candidatus Nanopelagicaceae bacterium]
MSISLLLHLLLSTARARACRRRIETIAATVKCGDQSAANIDEEPQDGGYLGTNELLDYEIPKEVRPLVTEWVAIKMRGGRLRMPQKMRWPDGTTIKIDYLDVPDTGKFDERWKERIKSL